MLVATASTHIETSEDDRHDLENADQHTLAADTYTPPPEYRREETHFARQPVATPIPLTRR
jgi:hypothetical protein